jgi:hypothetical protein|tara:strand:- start:320 stop:1372 length:1053 start_codon:yes stop_codon:yes gene_type:complete
MSKWSIEKSQKWYDQNNWIVGCNYLPSNAINQLEMFQKETFDEEINKKELSWARQLGFNSVRVYLHDLLWADPIGFSERLNILLDICASLEIKPLLVLFDDCHRPYPKLGIQPKPVAGVHNSGWKQSPGMAIVNSIHEEQLNNIEIIRLKRFVTEILSNFKDDERILMWDIYNEPGQFGIGDKSLTLLELTWEWAYEVRPSQPLTACLDGSVGEGNIKLNAENSDIITFHTYEGEKLQETIDKLKVYKRPLICTEYMAREFGSTFEFSLPIFKENNIGCYNWGLVAGKSQTHFGWSTILDLQKKKEDGKFLEDGDDIPEPEIWFHDILRKDGTAYNEKEVEFIKAITARS